MADKPLKQAVVDIYDPDPVPAFSQLMLDCQEGSGYTDDERAIIRAFIKYLRK